jgi:F0F1-type ATP synthase alpha subunit
MLGRVVNTLGAPIDGKGPVENDGFSPIDVLAPGVIIRVGDMVIDGSVRGRLERLADVLQS